MKKVAVIVGSLRKESFNRKLAKAMMNMAPKELKLEFLEISGLSMYNQDFDESPPKDWTDFREKLQSYDGVLFFTPEYNRSVPGVLKNAIDIGSRPSGKSSWGGKPTAIVSATPGPLGAFGANHHLRQSLMVLNMPAMAQPEAYVPNVAKIFDEKGAISDEKVHAMAEKFMKAYGEWLTANSK